MTFRVLHTGDWHIGKPFGRFPAEQASVLRHARLTAIDRLAEAARAGGAQHILVAGDIYDRPNLADRALREPIARMAHHSDLTWHLIPGNHDPAGFESVWARVKQDELPAAVRLHLDAAPVQLAEACYLLPAPLYAKAMTRDPTAWFDQSKTPDGALRIGLAHGSIQGFGSAQQASIQISPQRVATAGLDYLALGDWHGARQVGPRIWYAGTPEPESYLDNAPGFALLVGIEAHAPPKVERRPIGIYRWMQRTLDVSADRDLNQLEAELAGMGAASGQVLLDVTLSGRVSLERDRTIAARLERLDAALFHLSRREVTLRLAPDGEDLATLQDAALRRLGESLARSAADPMDPKHAVAARALRRLFAVIEAEDTI